MSQNKNLIFIVAYNHEHFIKKVVARIPEVILADPGNEVLIIDDGSKDKTFFTGDSIRNDWKFAARLTVLRNPINQGYGGNQKIGYRYAVDHNFERVFLIHGDGQYAPELLPKLLDEYSATSKPDAVFGTRMADWISPLKGGMPFYKFVGNKVLTRIENFLLHSHLSEFHSGYRSYSTKILKQIPFELNSNDFHFDTDIIIQVLAAGGKISEVPMPTKYGDEVCHVNGMQYAKNVVLSCLHFRVHELGFLYDRKFDILAHLGERPRPRAGLESIQNAAVERVTANSKVLLLFCGLETVSGKLAAKGCRVHKVDLTRELSSLESVLRSDEYDFIVLPNALERLAMPEQTLDLIRHAHVARKSPIVIATTGNIGFFIVRSMLLIGRFNYGKGGILDRAHTRLFNQWSLRWAFEQSGFVVSSFDSLGLSPKAVFQKTAGWVVPAEKLANRLARFWRSLFAYQLLIEAKPLPTVPHLLELSQAHSAALREDVRRVEMH